MFVILSVVFFFMVFIWKVSQTLKASSSDKQPNKLACFLRNAVLHDENQSEGVSVQIMLQ